MVYLPTCYMYKKNQPIQCRYICHTWICVGLKTKDGIISSDFPSSPCLRVKPLGRENGGSNGCWLQPLSIDIFQFLPWTGTGFYPAYFKISIGCITAVISFQGSDWAIESLGAESSARAELIESLSLPASCVSWRDEDLLFILQGDFCPFPCLVFFHCTTNEKSWMSKGCFWKSSWDSLTCCHFEVF